MSRGQRNGSPRPLISVFQTWSRYFFIQVAPQLISRGWVDLVPDPLLLRKSGSAGNRTRDLCICSQKYIYIYIHTHTHTHTHTLKVWINLHTSCIISHAFALLGYYAYIVQEARWAPGPVWTGSENLAPTGIRSLDRPARSIYIYIYIYIYICLFDVRLPEDDGKKIEACGSISGLYVKVYNYYVCICCYYLLKVWINLHTSSIISQAFVLLGYYTVYIDS